ncbi:hypothetical protein HPB50_011049 [Hyalomma asiaticum]|uniref:Uncharacterized protein n=1 Tax=Hyalomma asiaticum TaxID=266040 RepID=A0ACB7SXF9_HYAAI|nr:hypothetical protein HPB50_011049 [Hyalomma asiaticum]
MFAHHVLAGAFALCALSSVVFLYRPARAYEVGDVEDVQTVLRFARCRATCLDKLGLQMDKDNIECVGDKECNMAVLDVPVPFAQFPGCQQACSFWYKLSPKQLGNPLTRSAEVYSGVFSEPARLEAHGAHAVRVTWCRPESAQDDTIERALVYVLFLRGLVDEQRWEDVAQTQYLNVTISRSQLKQASELKVVALSPHGVFARTQVGLGLESAAFDSEQADGSIGSSLPVFAAPRVMELKHSSRHRVEVDIAWEFDHSPEAKKVKYEVVWRIPDKAVDVTGRMYTSRQSATLQLWEGATYSIFVRRLSPVNGEPDAETLSRYLDTPVIQPEPSTGNPFSTAPCVRLEVVAACCVVATAVTFISVLALVVVLMRNSIRLKNGHPTPTKSTSSEKGGSERRSRRGSQLCNGAKSLLGMNPGSGPSSPVGESREDLLTEAQNRGGVNQCFVYDAQSA